MAIRRRYIRELVESLLTEHKIKKPEVDVEGLAKSMGLEVRAESVDEDLSGFLFRDGATRRAVIGVNASHHPNRRRFTIAHELGHFLLHKGEPVHVDGANVAYRLDRRDERSSSGQDEFEREANLFAAELLMPKRFLDSDLATRKIDLLDDDVVTDIAREYGVSTQALTFRLMNLGLVDRGE